VPAVAAVATHLDQNRPVRTPTPVLQVDPESPAPDRIADAADALLAGRLVAFPTETVYGLGAVMDDRAALGRVFTAKGRPATDPLILHVAGIEQLAELVVELPPAAELLAERFWPGPLTLVLPRSDAVPDEVAAGGPSVAVRLPSHPVALALLRAVGRPVAAPSANRFGRISPTTAAHVVAELDGRIDLVVDGGPTTLGLESTVVDLGAGVPQLLRPGGVTLEDLHEVLGEVDHVERTVVDESDAATAPGQFLRHYAPRTPLVMVQGDAALLDGLLRSLDDEGIAASEVRLAEDGDDAARELYSQLRSADAGAGALLLVRAHEPSGIGRAVNDRLFRAAHGRVVADLDATTVERLVRVAGDTGPADARG
jgi:L-threonylcarbamoyladenylate synthase